MSEVFYVVNNITIKLEEVLTEAYSETPIMDERGNYVMTEFYCQFRAIYNPFNVSYRKIGGLLQEIGNQFPPVTENAIRHHLSQPRGQLLWNVGGHAQLRSPSLTSTLAGINVDAQNGPIPTVHQISRVDGNKTYEVVWSVKTWLSESDKWTTSPPVMTSNTWEQSETITGDEGRYYCVRVTNGRAKFDTSKIPAAYVPDDYRRWVLPALLRGFRRDRIDVTATADGTAIQYRVVDVEQRLGFRARDISKIDVIQSAGTTLPGVTSTITSAISAVGTSYQAGMVAAKVAERAGMSNSAVEGIGRAGAVLAFAMAFGSMLPMENYEITIKVWGTKNATMSYLQEAATKVLNARLRTPFARVSFDSSIRVIHDPVAGMVQMTYAKQTGLVNLAAGIPLNANTLAEQFMANRGDDLEATVAIKHPLTYPIGPGVTAAATDEGSNVPPMNNNSRGYFLGRLMSQALAGFTEKPAAPTAAAITNPVPGDPNR